MVQKGRGLGDSEAQRSLGTMHLKGEDLNPTTSKPQMAQSLRGAREHQRHQAEEQTRCQHDPGTDCRGPAPSGADHGKAEWHGRFETNRGTLPRPRSEDSIGVARFHCTLIQFHPAVRNSHARRDGELCFGWLLKPTIIVAEAIPARHGEGVARARRAGYLSPGPVWRFLTESAGNVRLPYLKWDPPTVISSPTNQIRSPRRPVLIVFLPDPQLSKDHGRRCYGEPTRISQPQSAKKIFWPDEVLTRLQRAEQKLREYERLTAIAP